MLVFIYVKVCSKMHLEMIILNVSTVPDCEESILCAMILAVISVCKKCPSQNPFYIITSVLLISIR